MPYLVVGKQRGRMVDLDRVGREELISLRVPSAAAEYLRSTHSNLLVLRAASNERSALDMLLQQEVSYAVVDEARLSQPLREPQFAGLSIVGDIGLPKLLRVASRRDEPLLAEIVSKTLQAMPSGELEHFANALVSTQYRSGR